MSESADTTADLGTFVVKVQVPLYPPGAREVLVYNEERTVQKMFPLTREIKTLMRGRKKAFFFARISKKRNLVVEEDAPWQEW